MNLMFAFYMILLLLLFVALFSDNRAERGVSEERGSARRARRASATNEKKRRAPSAGERPAPRPQPLLRSARRPAAVHYEITRSAQAKVLVLPGRELSLLVEAGPAHAPGLREVG